MANIPDTISQLQGSAPAGWTATKEARAGIDAQWIRRFKDKQLNQLVNEGLKNNGSLQASAERVKQAQQRARIAASEGRPQLGAGVSGNRQRSIFLGIPGGGGSTYNAFGVALEASWEIDLWGRIRAGRDADIAAFQSESWQQRAAEASLQAQITKAYFALVESNQQIELAQQSIEIVTQTRDAIADRFNSALSDEGGSAAQYRVAESDIASAQAELARWKGQRDSAARQLELILGRYPSASISAKQTLPELPATPPVGLPSELLLRRPDILAAERRYVESLQRKEEASRAVFPALSLTGSAGTNTMELGNILNSDFGVWSLGASLVQPILTGGRLQAEKVLRRSEVKARLIELQDTVLRGFSEVEIALAAERYLRERVVATQQAAQFAHEAREAAKLDYQSGTASVQTLLSAETRYIQTTSALVSLKRLMLDNRIDLHLALGGDYTPSSK